MKTTLLFPFLAGCVALLAHCSGNSGNAESSTTSSASAISTPANPDNPPATVSGYMDTSVTTHVK